MTTYIVSDTLVSDANIKSNNLITAKNNIYFMQQKFNIFVHYSKDYEDSLIIDLEVI